MATKLGAVAKCDYSELLYGCSRRLVGNKVVVSFRGFVPRSYTGGSDGIASSSPSGIEIFR